MLDISNKTFKATKHNDLFECAYLGYIGYGITADQAITSTKWQILKQRIDNIESPCLVIQNKGLILMHMNLSAVEKWGFWQFYRPKTKTDISLHRLFSVSAVAAFQYGVNKDKISFSYDKEKLIFNVRKIMLGDQAISVVSLL